MSPQSIAKANPTAAMLVIGDEILSGRTQDSNTHHLATELTAIGIDLKEVRVVPDEAPEIIAAVNALRTRYAHVFTSGGIGPTHDDITADSIAEAFGLSIDVREDARAALIRNYKNGEADLTPARLRMARVPDGAVLIDNPISGAPGFTVENVHVMAGVPSVFIAMVASLLPQLEAGSAITSVTLRVDQPESHVAEKLGVLAARFSDLTIGSYPFIDDGKFGTNLVIRGASSERVAEGYAALLEAFGPA